MAVETIYVIEEKPLTATPTYQVACVFVIFVLLSVIFEQALHQLGKYFSRNKQIPLLKVLEKIKDELMLLGFISLLLALLGGNVARICVSPSSNLLTCPADTSSEVVAVETPGPAHAPAAHEAAHLPSPAPSAAAPHHTQPPSLTLLPPLPPPPPSNSSAGRSLRVESGRALAEGGTTGAPKAAADGAAHPPSSAAETGAHEGAPGAESASASGEAYPKMICVAEPCPEGQVSFISTEGLHQLHIFIFLLAMIHILYCVIAMGLAYIQVHRFWNWEEEEEEEKGASTRSVADSKFSRQATLDTSFYDKHASNLEKRGLIHKTGNEEYPMELTHLGGVFLYIRGFVRQFIMVVDMRDYLAIRKMFILDHGLPDDYAFGVFLQNVMLKMFRKVVGTSWWLWVLASLLVLLNVYGWGVYFWASLVPLVLVLVLGTKMQVAVTRMALEDMGIGTHYTRVLLRKLEGVEEEGARKQMEAHVRCRMIFWFGQPRLFLSIVHFILFQSAFEIAAVLWFLWQFGSSNCFFNRLGFIIARTVISVVAPLLCSIFTLPLFALLNSVNPKYDDLIQSAEESDTEGH